MRLILDIASRSNKYSYFRLANEQLYYKAQEKKTGCAALGTEFVWKEMKILRNKNILVLVFKHVIRFSWVNS